MIPSGVSGVRVVGLGAQTPVGRSVPATAAAVRARLPMIGLHPFLVDRFGEPVTVARAPWLPASVGLRDRLLALGKEAAREALEAARGLTAPHLRWAVVIGLPEERPGVPRSLAQTLLTALIAELLPQARIIEKQARSLGHAAGLAALEEGCRLIRDGKVDVCLAGGMESYIDRLTIEWIDWTWQLHAPSHSWGFIPGEAAGFCVLASDQAAASAKLESLATIRSAALTKETKLRRDRAVCIGEGLTAAFGQVLGALPSTEKVDQLIGDLNGQPYRADEFGFAMTRLGGRFHDPGRFHTPADCWGDIGAASGPLFVSLAVMAGKKRYARGPHTLAWASSMVAERSAILIHVPVRPEG